MKTTKIMSLRCYAARPVTSGLRFQRRWARVHSVRFLVTHQASERINDRYKNKLQQKAREQGLENVSQLKEAYKDKISDLRKRAIVPGATGPLRDQAQAVTEQAPHHPPWAQPPPPPPQPSDLPQTSSSPFKPSSVKTLSSFLDVPKILELPSREIESVWRLRHAANPQSLCAAIPSSTFATILATARKNPQFVLPGLPRQKAEVQSESESPAPEGAPIHYMQWNFTGPDTVTVLFTHLAEFQLRGEYAQPHTTVTHHLELSQPKGLVLCQGSVMEGRGVSIEEGKWLVMCMQKFYNTGSARESRQLDSDSPNDIGEELRRRRRRLVEQFNQGDTSFSIEQLLEEAERMG